MPDRLARKPWMGAEDYGRLGTVITVIYHVSDVPSDLKFLEDVILFQRLIGLSEA